jgi:LacI family transcriptional regulator
MLVPDIANPFFPPIIKGAEEAAHARGYTLVLCNTDDLPEREATYLRVMRDGQVDGLLIASTRMADETITTLRGEGFPFVLVNRGTHGEGDLSVTVDNHATAAEAVTHLISLGHRRIGHIAGPQTTTTGVERAEGARAALVAAGLDPTLRTEAQAWSEAAGHRAALALLDRSPTAVFGANDLIALGTLRAARERGLRVPDDLSVVGFNDIGEAALLDLTTVRVPQQLMGGAAAALLIARLEGEHVAEPGVVLPAQLVVRGSTRSLLAAAIA